MGELQVICLGLYYLPAKLSPYDENDSLDLPLEWRDVSERALALADWSGRPQVRTIQAILLMAFYWYNIGFVVIPFVERAPLTMMSREIDRLVVWVGAGVRVAQSLGLHTADKQPTQCVILLPS